MCGNTYKTVNKDKGEDSDSYLTCMAWTESTKSFKICKYNSKIWKVSAWKGKDDMNREWFRKLHVLNLNNFINKHDPYWKKGRPSPLKD